MKTRKDFILGGLGTLAVPYIGRSEPRRAMLGAVETGEYDSGEWVNPYVTDGLIAMWDGEWNAGGGIHNDNATDIVDLSGNNHTLKFMGGYGIGRDYIYIDGTSGAYGFVESFTFVPPVTQDMCVEIESRDPYGRFVGEARGLCCYSRDTGTSRIGHLYGFGVDRAFDIKVEPGFNIPFSQSLAVLDGLATFYYNGSSKSNLSCYNPTYTNTTYIFGRDTKGRGITGRIYNLRFYNRALTDEEIFYNYAIDKERFGI